MIRSHGGGRAVRWQRRLAAAIRTAARHAAHRKHNDQRQAAAQTAKSTGVRQRPSWLRRIFGGGK